MAACLDAEGLQISINKQHQVVRIRHLAGQYQPSLMDLQGSTIPKMGDFSVGEAETVGKGTSA